MREGEREKERKSENEGGRERENEGGREGETEKEARREGGREREHHRGPNDATLGPFRGLRIGLIGQNNLNPNDLIKKSMTSIPMILSARPCYFNPHGETL